MVENMSGLLAITNQLEATSSKLTDSQKKYNIIVKMLKAIDIKDPSLYINNPEEPAEQVIADNEQLNAIAMQQQEQIQALSEQVRQLQALSEVEVIKAKAKEGTDNKKLAIDAAKLDENARQFDVKISQDGSQFQQDKAFDLTKLETDSGKELNMELQDNMLVFDPAIGDFI